MRGWTANDIERLNAKGMVARETVKKSVNNIQKNVPRISEDDIQKQCFTWFAFQYPDYRKRIFHIPNGGQRNIVVAAKLKSQGTLAGVWDIFLSVPKYGFSGMFIEMKAGKNKLTGSQEEFREANYGDYLFKVCYSLEDFKMEIDKYLL